MEEDYLDRQSRPVTGKGLVSAIKIHAEVVNLRPRPACRGGRDTYSSIHNKWGGGNSFFVFLIRIQWDNGILKERIDGGARVFVF